MRANLLPVLVSTWPDDFNMQGTDTGREDKIRAFFRALQAFEKGLCYSVPRVRP